VMDMSDWYYFIRGDESQIWSRRRCMFVPVTDAEYVAWANVGMVEPFYRATVLPTQDDLVGLLRRDGAPPYHQVRKSTVLSRLGDEKVAQAFALASVGQQLRWNAPDRPKVNADDPETVALIVAVGGDPAVILAPEV